MHRLLTAGGTCAHPPRTNSRRADTCGLPESGMLPLCSLHLPDAFGICFKNAGCAAASSTPHIRKHEARRDSCCHWEVPLRSISHSCDRNQLALSRKSQHCLFASWSVPAAGRAAWFPVWMLGLQLPYSSPHLCSLDTSWPAAASLHLRLECIWRWTFCLDRGCQLGLLGCSRS